MKNLSRKANKVLFAVVVLTLFMVFSYAMGSVLRMKNYDILLDADTMNVYREDILIGTANAPGDIMDTYNGSVGVGVIDFSQLGIEKTELVELYRLEFVKDNKVISDIEILAPKSVDNIAHSSLGTWRKCNGHYVVMYERGYYFTFGELFFDNLSKILD